jgi:hypothetical protein
VHACNPSTPESGGLLLEVIALVGLQEQFKTNLRDTVRLCLKNKNKEKITFPCLCLETMTIQSNMLVLERWLHELFDSPWRAERLAAPGSERASCLPGTGALLLYL